jgi:hypothetical protein
MPREVPEALPATRGGARRRSSLGHPSLLYGKASHPGPSGTTDPAVLQRHRSEMTPRPRSRPPGAEATLAARRGPAWLIAVLDFLERQLDLADNPQERIKLLGAYTRAIVAVSVPFLVVATLGIWVLDRAHLSSLVILAATGIVTGFGVRIRRLRRVASRRGVPDLLDQPTASAGWLAPPSHSGDDDEASV